jgi:quercetin dioxygenase-like cupin family protein
MNTVDLATMELIEGWFADDDSVHFRANFALVGGDGAERSSLVYVELEPGKALGEHMDSPEETLLVLDGDVEMQIGQDRVRARRGQLAVVPAMIPHSFRNVGRGTARVVGFFPSPGVVATFVEPVQPINQHVMRFGQTDAAAAEAEVALQAAHHG